MMRQFHQDDVDFVYISGTRGLYFGAGANYVAIETRFLLGKNSLGSIEPAVQLRPANLEYIDLLVKIAESESVRFIRPRGDFELVIENEHCSGQPCKFHLIELQDIPVGYLLIRGSKDDKRLRVIEMAGDRLCIRSALSKFLQENDTSLEVNVPHGDLLINILASAGIRGELVKTGGTMKVIDFCRTMRKLLPYFRERLSGWTCLDLNLVEGKERYVAWNEKGYIQLEGEKNMMWTLIGSLPDVQIEGIRATGKMQELIERCLPIPIPLLYLNMI